MPLQRLVSLALFCALALASSTTYAAGRNAVPRGKDLKRAADVVSKLRRLEEAAATQNPGAYRKAARKIYPGIFASVASLRGGDIKTDLSTALALYETAYRDGAGTGVDAPDCSRELRTTYFQLCRESASRTRMLWAKARLHTHFAEAAILYARGDRSASTLDVLAQISTERSTDIALADEALRSLKEAAAELTGDSSVRTVAARGASPDRDAKQLSERAADALANVECILASLPRGQVRQLISNARDAFRDALFWQLKAMPGRSLIVNVNSLDAPDPLRRINLGTDVATRASLQNLRGALKFIGKAGAAIDGVRASK